MPRCRRCGFVLKGHRRSKVSPSAESRSEGVVEPLAPNSSARRVEFVYDYLGRRVAKRVYNWDVSDANNPHWTTAPAEERRFVWSGGGLVWRVADAAGAGPEQSSGLWDRRLACQKIHLGGWIWPGKGEPKPLVCRRWRAPAASAGRWRWRDANAAVYLPEESRTVSPTFSDSECPWVL